MYVQNIFTGSLNVLQLTRNSIGDANVGSTPLRGGDWMTVFQTLMLVAMSCGVLVSLMLLVVSIVTLSKKE